MSEPLVETPPVFRKGAAISATAEHVEYILHEAAGLWDTPLETPGQRAWYVARQLFDWKGWDVPDYAVLTVIDQREIDTFVFQANWYSE